MRLCDITYCSSLNCTNTECERNIKHLLGADVVVSMCDFAGTCDDYSEENTQEVSV